MLRRRFEGRCKSCSFKIKYVSKKKDDQFYCYQVTFHPNAPMLRLLRMGKLLHETSATTSICDPSKRDLRILVILNRVTGFELRSVLRKTYADFGKKSSDGFVHLSAFPIQI